MGSEQIQLYQPFEIEICCNCGITFAAPRELVRKWQQTGKSFCCPYGHFQSYGENENSKLKKQLANAKKRTEWAESDAKDARKANQRLRNTVRAEKGAKTKLKKRIANGVCPCCQRSFVNLARHMDSQHKDYGKGNHERHKNRA